MKKIIFVIITLLMVLLLACNESEVVAYNEPHDGIYFKNFNAPEFVQYNFANSNKGDSLQVDTVKLVLNVLGRPAQQDRKVFFRITPIKDLDDTGINLIDYPKPFIFRAKQATDTARFLIHRPAKRQIVYGIGVEIDVANAESSFVAGVKEYMTTKIKLTDYFSKPSQWEYSEPWYGEYSVEKHAFIVTVLKRTDFWDDWSKGAQNIALREALDAYNETHPDTPKDFTFPVKTSDW